VVTLQLAASLVDLGSGRVRRLGTSATLSPLDLRLLRYLVARPGESLGRGELLGEVWSGEGSERAVDAAVRSLRVQVEVDPSRPDHIQTVHGTGYRFHGGAQPAGEARLPRQWDEFVGRGDELFEVGSGFLLGHRLLTLHGPAGVGKTRLALRFAATAAVHGLDVGALFVQLAHVTDLTGLCAAVAAAMDLPLSGEVEPAARVGRALRGTEGLLLVLDNAEQLIDVLGPVLAGWMEAAPAVRWLVTTQKPLGLVSERLLPLGPLSESEAVRLFEDRARALGARGGQLDGELMATVCRRVEGLPLAVELAAARVPALGLARLDAALGESLALLSRRGWDGEPRHATLHAAINWSWSLLDEQGQRALAACSVFRGSLPLAGAAAVLDVRDAAAELDKLVAASLVRREAEAGSQTPRYSLSVPVREFAALRLAQGDAGEGVSARHRKWCLELVGRVGGELWATTPTGDADRLMLELPNLLVAHQGLLQHDPAEALALALALEPILKTRGSLQQLSALLSASLAAAEAAPADLRARALAAWSLLCADLGDRDAARAALEQALPLARESGDPATLAWVLMRDGLLCTRSGEGDGERGEGCLLEARLLAQEAGQEGLEAEVCTVLGILRENQGRLDEAAEILDAALRLGRNAEHPRAVGAALGNLSIVAGRRGDAAAAQTYRDEATAVYRAQGNKPHLAVMLINQGVAAVQVGDYETGVVCSKQAIAACRGLGDADGEAIATSNLALGELELGREEAAETGLHRAIEQFVRLGGPREEGYAHMGLGVLYQRRGALPGSETELRRSVELFRRHGDDIAMLMAQSLLALVELEMGNEQAAETLEEVRRRGAQRSARTLDAALGTIASAFAGEPLVQLHNSHYERVVSAAVSAFRART